MQRLQIPAYTDRWMMGDRFGELIKVTRQGKVGARAALLTRASKGEPIEIAQVRLDKSGDVVHVVLADCESVS